MGFLWLSEAGVTVIETQAIDTLEDQTEQKSILEVRVAVMLHVSAPLSNTVSTHALNTRSFTGKEQSDF